MNGLTNYSCEIIKITFYFKNNCMRRSNTIIVITIVSAIVIIGIPWIQDIIEKDELDSNRAILGNETPELSGDVAIGVILPTSGDLATVGNENLVSIELAIEDFNEYLTNKTHSWRLEPIIRDSATSPSVTYEHISFLNRNNITTVIGLVASENIRNIKDYSDANNMLLVSCCSSAPALAIPNDSVYRLVPDDSNEGAALAKLIHHEGIKVIVPVWRDDIWGNGIQKTTAESFNKTQVIVDPGFIYYPNSPNSVDMTILNKKVQGYVGNYTADKVAVLFLGFGEISYLMESAGKLENSILDKVRWFGSGAITKERQINDNPKSFEFAQKINLTTVQVATSQNPTYEKVKAHLIEKTGLDPSSTAYSSYDMVWIVGEAMLQANSSDASEIKKYLNNTLTNPTYKRSLSSNTFNNMGDLKQANYEIWRLGYDGNWNSLGHISSLDSKSMN